MRWDILALPAAQVGRAKARRLAATFDIRGVILDNHIPHDGSRVLNELKRIPKMDFPVHLGLRYRMRSKEDTTSGEVGLSGVRFLGVPARPGSTSAVVRAANSEDLPEIDKYS